MNLIRSDLPQSSLLLLLSGASIGAAGSDIADAVMRGDAAAVRALLERKADVNAAQADGATALHWAVYRNDLSLVDVLIGAGANVKAANRFGATPLSLACEIGDAGLIERLLKGGADPNEALPRGETPLMFAARTGKVDAIRVLLDHGAQRERERSAAWNHRADVGGGSGPPGRGSVARRTRRGHERPFESRPEAKGDGASRQSERAIGRSRARNPQGHRRRCRREGGRT